VILFRKIDFEAVVAQQRPGMQKAVSARRSHGKAAVTQ
jgi:hypothetical protein